MISLFQQAPPERIIDNEGDGLKGLRAVRDQYMEKGVNPKITGEYYRNAAQAVADLIGYTLVDVDDTDEITLGEIGA